MYIGCLNEVTGMRSVHVSLHENTKIMFVAKKGKVEQCAFNVEVISGSVYKQLHRDNHLIIAT